ncbi:SWIM zinc finger family protein [uncultured Desulfosarcina sp.]|uniref:SWIM zinc finger family protein n=1 Tax=uncultured Desulfosarcina sp. TaxID=218289 RepID=UPI0029C9959F|nr:SWIM zinc finger family protein [uncultured Desulfosarcina sp.]
MTATELQKRNEKSDHLRVLQTDSGQFFVESGEGKILYSVTINDAGDSCTCGDFAKNIKRDPDFKCKHILAVFNAVPKREVEGAVFLEKHVPRLDERWITKIEGKEFVKYPGLLDLAHQHGLSSIEVDIVQMPTNDNGNFAVCRATVMSKIGETFTDIGDANPNNCSSKVSRHLLRMASTRSIARALRSYTNVGMTALEELADFNDAIPEGGKNEYPTQPKAAKKPAAKTPKKTSPAAAKPKAKPAPVAPAVENQTQEKPAGQTAGKDNAGPRMSEAQKRAIYNLSRRRGISVEQLEQMVADAYACDLETLTSSDASAFIRQLQQAA